IVCDLAARLRGGKPLPDGTATTDGAANVVICTLEDGYADTVRPRLEAAGADLTRIHFFDRVKLEGQDFSRTPVFPDDLRYLEAAITQTGARFVIVDPLFAYLNTKTT